VSDLGHAKGKDKTRHSVAATGKKEERGEKKTPLGGHIKTDYEGKAQGEKSIARQNPVIQFGSSKGRKKG